VDVNIHRSNSYLKVLFNLSVCIFKQKFENEGVGKNVPCFAIPSPSLHATAMGFIFSRNASDPKATPTVSGG
jgi:hypothetical protein